MSYLQMTAIQNNWLEALQNYNNVWDRWNFDEASDDEFESAKIELDIAQSFLENANSDDYDLFV